MRAVHTLSIILAVTLYLSIISMAEGRSTWYCTPCQGAEDCDKEPSEFCMWGETRDACNRRVCSKGPGDRCGTGRRDIIGKCGTGMWCQKEEESSAQTCHGCYENTLDCHQSKRY